jgi:hypothetical protein
MPQARQKPTGRQCTDNTTSGKRAEAGVRRGTRRTTTPSPSEHDFMASQSAAESVWQTAQAYPECTCTRTGTLPNRRNCHHTPALGHKLPLDGGTEKRVGLPIPRQQQPGPSGPAQQLTCDPTPRHSTTLPLTVLAYRVAFTGLYPKSVTRSPLQRTPPAQPTTCTGRGDRGQGWRHNVPLPIATLPHHTA